MIELNSSNKVIFLNSIGPENKSLINGQRRAVFQTGIRDELFVVDDIEKIAKERLIHPGALRELFQKKVWSLILPKSTGNFNADWFEYILTKIFHSDWKPNLIDREKFRSFTSPTGEKIIDFSIPLREKGSMKVTFGINWTRGVPCVCRTTDKKERFESHCKAVQSFPGPELYHISSDTIYEELWHSDLTTAIENGWIDSYSAKLSIAEQLLAILCEIQHKDVSPDNILLQWKKTGIRAIFTDYEAHFHKSNLTTPLYCSPERARLICKRVWDFAKTPKEDIWALGVILCNLFLPKRIPPWFHAQSSIEAYRILARYTYSHWMDSPPNPHSLHALLWRMTHFDPDQRP
ncbi:MAG: hypothetical protein KGJ02_06250, partial [Verrucomicrobiota bacterium]|nr:hypothetical protein [Verrucomicrobiota bacterium]